MVMHLGCDGRALHNHASVLLEQGRTAVLSGQLGARVFAVQIECVAAQNAAGDRADEAPS
jgi:hypothetical protein